MGYFLCVSKIGELKAIVSNIENNNDLKIDSNQLKNLILNYKVNEEDVKTLEKMVLFFTLQSDKKFEKHFKITIVDENDKVIAKPFSQNNNLKQLVIYEELKRGIKYPSLRLLISNYHRLDEIEKESNLPFYSFNQEQVTKFANSLATYGNSPHTIATKLSLMVGTQDRLNKLFDDLGFDIKNKNIWRDTVKARRTTTSLRQTNRRHFLSYEQLMNEVMPADVPGNTVPVLLLYHGVRMGTKEGSDELMQLRWDDVSGNKIHIRGDHERTIKLTDEEMSYINSLKERKTPGINSSYLLIPYNTRRNDGTPLKRWTVWKRIKDLSKKLNLPANDQLTEKNIRLSGQLFWIQSELIKRFGRTDVKYDDFYNVAISAFIVYAEYSKEEIEELGQKESSKLDYRVRSLRQTIKQLEKSRS